jgi:hypothetical protein
MITKFIALFCLIALVSSKDEEYKMTTIVYEGTGCKGKELTSVTKPGKVDGTVVKCKEDGETLEILGNDITNGKCMEAEEAVKLDQDLLDKLKPDGKKGTFSVKYEWTGACTKFPVWAIVLIVIVNLLFVACIGYLIYWCCCRKYTNVRTNVQYV